MKFKNFIKQLSIFINTHQSLVFWTLLIAISLFYQYQRIIVLRPQSVHQWRQTDCTSQALNYYQNSMNFFKPEIHNRDADSGNSGYCAGEFPGVFYVVACLYKIFGVHEWIYRLLSIMVFFVGLFALFKTALYFTKDYFWSVFIGIFLFLSPVFVFYANNFTANTSSFAIALVGWLFFFLFYSQRKGKYLYLSIAMFTLASLFKLSEAMSLFVVAGIYFFEITGIIKFNKTNPIFKRRIQYLIPFVLSGLIIISWYIYAAQYNKIHQQIYYEFAINPIWKMTSLEIKNTWIEIRERWYYDYFHVSIFILILVSFLGNLVLIKKSNKLLMFITLTLFIGSIFYLLLWYNNLRNHDYYVISIYILFVFSFLTFFDILKRSYDRLLSSIYLKLFMLLVIILNVILTRNNFVGRYRGWQNDYTFYKDVHTITPFLRSLGITRNDKVICMPDMSPNYTLYLMNQPGWTNFYGPENDEKMDQLLKKGAKYLILVGDEIFNKPYLGTCLYHPIGKYGNVSIFKLDSVKNDKEIKEPFKIQLAGEIICDAEKLTSGRRYFIGSNNLWFTNGNAQTSEKAHSGKFSAKVNKDRSFTMDILFANVKAGDRYKVSVWRFPKNIAGTIVASIKSPKDFYKTDCKIEPADENGWEQISMEFEVPKELNNEKMGIDLWYHGNNSENCYFDDLKIQQLKQISSNNK
jgi:hypothetical protein